MKQHHYFNLKQAEAAASKHALLKAAYKKKLAAAAKLKMKDNPYVKSVAFGNPIKVLSHRLDCCPKIENIN